MSVREMTTGAAAGMASRVLVVALAVSLVGCGISGLGGGRSGDEGEAEPQEAESPETALQEAPVKSDGAGVTVVSLGPSRTHTRVSPGPSVAGQAGATQVVFPPGAILLETDLSVFEADPLMEGGGLPDELGVPGVAAEAAGPAVAIMAADVETMPAAPYTISLALPEGAGLSLTAGRRLAILYRIWRGGEARIGLLSGPSLSAENGRVTFEIDAFGVFQALWVAEHAMPPRQEAVAREAPAVRPRHGAEHAKSGVPSTDKATDESPRPKDEKGIGTPTGGADRPTEQGDRRRGRRARRQ